jgi:hypothetical protein
VEDRLDLPLQLHGHDRLGNPIGHGRHAKDPRAAPMGLLDLHRAHGRREVRSRGHPIPDLVQVVLKIRLELRDRLPVHPQCALVRLDFLPRLPDRPLRNLKRLVCCFQTSHGQPGPFAPAPLQDLHRYYEPVRQRARRRYSIPCGVAAWDTPSPPLARTGRIRTCLLLFHTEAADQAHVVYMPDTTWPEDGTPARLVPGSV